MIELLNITIPNKWNNLMIKEILFEEFDFSRKSLAKIKNNKGIFLNNTPVYVNAIVKTGDQLQLFTKEETSEGILPQPIPINIVYEDNDIVVINKQAGIVVHPTRNHYLETIANGLMYYWQAKGKSFRFRPVHRLDKDTSGLFVIAKNQYSHHKLALQIEKRTLKRTYNAIVHREMENESGTIDAQILKDPNHSVKRLIAKDNPTAKRALTYYHTILIANNYSLVELELATGRTHQIRVHMSYINHPLVGDDLYGGVLNTILKRQALHASKLEFNHPISDKALSFTIPFPEDMNLFIRKYLMK